MYIVVVGGGQVGYRLAKILLGDGHEVLILEENPDRCEKLIEELGSVVYRGDGCEVVTLESVGTGRADLFVAVTDRDEVNLAACQVAKHRFNVPRTVARITDPANEAIFEILGVDVTVCSTQIILSHIEQELPSHPIIPLLKLKGGSLEVVEVKIPAGSRVVGKKLGDFSLPEGSAVLLVIGKNKGPQIPTKETVIEAEDEVVAITNPENEEPIRAILMGR